MWVESIQGLAGGGQPLSLLTTGVSFIQLNKRSHTLPIAARDLKVPGMPAGIVIYIIYYSVLYCIVVLCTILYCSIMYYTTLYYIIVYNNIL